MGKGGNAPSSRGGSPLTTPKNITHGRHQQMHLTVERNGAHSSAEPVCVSPVTPKGKATPRVAAVESEREVPKGEEPGRARAETSSETVSGQASTARQHKCMIVNEQPVTNLYFRGYLKQQCVSH